MKRFELIVIFFVVVITSQAQVDKVSYAQIGKLNFKLYETKISQIELEEIMNAFAAFGDKNVVFSEVLNYLVAPETSLHEDSLIQYWLNDFSEEEMVKLQSLPNISLHYMEKTYKIVMYSILGKSYLDTTSVIEAYVNINAKKNEVFPNMPTISNTSNKTELIKRYYDFSKWAINYPNELLFFQNLIQEQTSKHLKVASEENLIRWSEFVRQYIIEGNTIYDIYLPISLNGLIDSTNTHQKNIKYGSLCTPQNIKEFLCKSYELIFEEKISNGLLNKMLVYIKQNKIYEPKLIYLALILSKYE